MHQRLRREALCCLDGRPVVILHPGFLNREAGPDFQNALVRLGDTPARQGDVEIDLRPEFWRHHRHDTNPRYQGVILHVVWEGVLRQDFPLPTLAVRESLDAPLPDLIRWFELGGGSSEPAGTAGRCQPMWAKMDAEQRRTLLLQAAQIRLERKAVLLGQRAATVGWEQALWEGFFTALGFKHNSWAMRRVADLLPLLRQTGEQEPLTPQLLQARLLGIAGLLPSVLTHQDLGTDAYLRRLWDTWWRDRGVYEHGILPVSAWRLDGLRPANHPSRRLALAAHWLSTPRCLARLESWMLEPLGREDWAKSLLLRLQSGEDEFWTHHWTLRSKAISAARPLVGSQRVTDLAINVLLPWFWIRAQLGENREIHSRVETRWFQWPAAEDNARLRMARRRLMGPGKSGVALTAAVQQGLLQITRDFCARSNSLCEGCQLPELMKAELSTGRAHHEAHET